MISAEVDADYSQAAAGDHRLSRFQPRREGDRHPAWRRHRQFAQALKAAGKKPGEIVAGGIDLTPATIDGLKDGYVTVTLDQQLYLQGFLPVVQCVLTRKYGISGMRLNTAGGVITPETIDALVPLIEAGIR